MTLHHAGLADVVRRDPRYAYEAYEFVFQALEHTQRLLGRAALGERRGQAVDTQSHVRGPELLEGIRDLALREFGLMARTVFRQWGINSTDDFGEIVFNLVEAKLMSKTDDDCRADFHAVFALDEALVHGYGIELEKTE
ncbi:MAG TPA: Minf_1886 family protein [Gemmataceae bacterium]|nr:Minf_1886 family protein [Gemmataceae bacterium]